MMRNSENAGRGYLAYLLRMWYVDGGAPVWRASLQDAHGGSRYQFTDLESMFAFLRQRAAQIESGLSSDEQHEPKEAGSAGSNETG